MTQPHIRNNSVELSTERRTQWTQAANDWLHNFDSVQTRNTYVRAWEQFVTFTSKHPQYITQSDVITFKTHLTEVGQSDSTINLKLSALSSFYTFAIKRGLLNANPCDDVKRKNVKPYGKATYLNADKNQDVTLLEQPDLDTLIGKRDYAILLSLLTTGIRVSALVNATVGDVKKHAAGYILEYVNKGGETEKAELLPFVYEAIFIYLNSRENNHSKAPLFVTIEANRTSKKVKPLTRHAITAMISRYAKQARLHHITAHSLRHTAAMIATKTGTVAQVKAFLRHKSARTTAIYLDHVADNDVSEITNAVGNRYR